MVYLDKQWVFALGCAQIKFALNRNGVSFRLLYTHDIIVFCLKHADLILFFKRIRQNIVSVLIFII